MFMKIKAKEFLKTINTINKNSSLLIVRIRTQLVKLKYKRMETWYYFTISIPQ